MDEEKKGIAFEKEYPTHRVAFYENWIIFDIPAGGYSYNFYAFVAESEFNEAELSDLEFMEDYFEDGLAEDDLQELISYIKLYS